MIFTYQKDVKVVLSFVHVITYRPIRPNPLMPMPVTIFNDESLETAPFTAEPVKLFDSKIGTQAKVVCENERIQTPIFFIG